MTELSERKAELRARMRKVRGRLAPLEVARLSVALQTHAAGLPSLAAARSVGCYVSLAAEADTRALMAQVLAAGKRLRVPAYDELGDCYRFAELGTGTKLVTRRLGLLEPAQPIWVEPAELDLVFVPGLAFDAAGGRLGYGGGHYDGLIGAMRSDGRSDRLVVALAFECQLVAGVPRGERDQAVDLVVTENRVIRCR